MKRNTVDVITLGCSKNLVDSEKLLRQLQANGYRAILEKTLSLVFARPLSKVSFFSLEKKLNIPI